jgi:hypothetical protein
MLHVHVEAGRHPAALRRWFPAPEPDPFFEEDILCALYGDGWTSIVIEEDGHALRHAFSASAIGATGLRDIEPLVGYGGPLSTPGAPVDFLVAAIDRYRTLCRESGIVAELVRFNPLLQNHRGMEGLTADLVLLPPKPVVYLTVRRGDSDRMSSYPPATRNMVRAGYRSSNVSTLEKTPEVWTELRRFYDRTLDNSGAQPQWRLPLSLWERLQRHPRFMLFGAVQQERLVSGAVVLVHGDTWYYFLAAGDRDPQARRGAANAVVHAIVQAAALDGASRVALGGGRTTAADDSLLRFKSSFDGDVLPFTVGLFTHDRGELTSLVQVAERRDPAVSASPLFLRYRLAPEFSEGRMVPISLRPLVGRTA